MTRALVAAAAVLALALPAAADAESLVLQPSVSSTGPGGTVDVQVLARVHPNGKAVVAVRTSDVLLTAKGGGTVSPASDLPGEVRWTYRAPEAVASDLDVVLEAKLRSYPDAAGTCRLLVKAPAKPTPPPAPPPAAPPAVADAGDDEDGDLVEGAEATPADPVGKLVTLEKWRARPSAAEEWNERPLPARGEALWAPGLIQEYRFRINAANATAVEVQWWRADRPKRVRSFTAKNRQLEVDKDQDGLLIGRFVKHLNKDRGEYVFAIVVSTADGKTLRENLVVHREKPPKEEGDAKGKGKR